MLGKYNFLVGMYFPIPPGFYARAGTFARERGQHMPLAPHLPESLSFSRSLANCQDPAATLKMRQEAALEAERAGAERRDAVVEVITPEKLQETGVESD